MSLDPKERLETLRREVLAESQPLPASPAALPNPPPAPPSPTAAPTSLMASVPAAVPASASDASEPPREHARWSLAEAVGGAGLGLWVGAGLVGVGAYLVVSRFVPGIAVIGSALLLVAGVALLASHLKGRASAWALYSGAVLTAVGAARLIDDLLPISGSGLTAIGIGVAFLAIAYLRHSQADGRGWQLVVGAVALGYGLLELALDLLPGSTSPLDLVLPVGLIVVVGVVVSRVLQGGSARP